MIKRLLLVGVFCLLGPGWAWGHVDIEGSPDAIAILAYKQILYLNPNDLEARNRLAMALCRKNKFDEAKKELRFVLDKDGKNFDAIDGMGVLLLMQGKPQEALEYFEQAVKINEQDAMVYVHLSAAFYAMKRQDEARNAWKKAQSLASTKAERDKMKEELKWVSGR